MDRLEIESELLDFVTKRFRAAPGRLAPETHLFREGIVDSIGVLTLVEHLETRYGVQIEPQDMILDNFESIAAMRDFVERSARSAKG